MSHWIRHFSTYKQADELFSQLNARISELDIEQESDVKSYISYNNVVSKKVFMHVIPRQKSLRIRLEIPLAEIKETPVSVEFSEDRTWSPPRIYSCFNFKLVDQIEEIASLIQEACSYNRKESSPSPRVKGGIHVNEATLRKIIHEETDRLAKNEEIGSIVTNAIEPLVNKIDELGKRLDQSDETRARLISLSERMMTLYEQVVSENRELRESIWRMENSMSDVMVRVTKLEQQPAV